jgi:drug/metabolite transporter (DMT)-like permease
MVLGTASFACMDAIGKWAVGSYSVYQVLAVRSVFVAVVLLFLAPFFGGREVFRTAQPGAHVARALCSTLAFLFFYTSVRVLPLADAIAVEFGGPFIVVALSVPLLGEIVDRARWLAVAIGFLGMLLVVQPSAEGFRPEALLVLLASFSYSLMMVLTRWMSERSGGTERTFTFLVYTFLVQGMVGVAGALWTWTPMTPFDVAITSAMGLFTLGGHLGVTAAFQRAPASLVAPYEYTALVWATLFGLVFFHDFPKPMVWAGVAVIVASGLYTLRSEEPSARAKREVRRVAQREALGVGPQRTERSRQRRRSG